MSTAAQVGTITVTIDGQTIEVPKGTRILQAAQMLGKEIPTFCHHPRMRPNAACRICSVEVVKPFNRMLMACSTELADGMEVLTDSERTQEDRRTNLDLLLTQHPLDCPVCDKGGECKLQDYSVKYGSFENPFTTARKDYPEDIRSVVLDFNSNRCILCGACIQVCSDIQAVDAIGFSKRGFITMVGAPMGEALDCEFCGQCMDVCPVGAITSRFSKYKYRPWQEQATLSTCTYCGCGCQYEIRSVDGEVSRVLPVEGIGPGQGSLCVRGHFGFHFMESEERIQKPLVRRGDKLVETTWDQAIAEAAKGLMGVKTDLGGGALAGLVGGRLTNEEIYLFGRVMRNVLECHNLDSTLRYGGINAATVMRESLGLTGMMNSFDDLRHADAILLVGSDITEESPICGLAVKEAIKRGEKPVLTVDSMKTEIMKLGSHRLIIQTGTELAVIKGLVKAVVDEGLIDTGVAERHPAAVAAIREHLSGTFKEVETPTGVTRDQIVELAKVFAAAKKGIILAGPRVTAGVKGRSAFQMLVDLAFLTGKLETPGAGVNYLSGSNNEVGLALMGAAPELLPGGELLADDEARTRVAEAWGCVLPEHPGTHLGAMLAGMEEGRIKGALVAAMDPIGALPAGARAREAFGALDFLVVQDIFLTETARIADVVLPAQSYAEKDGTFTNMEGRVQEIRKAMKAPGKARPDWQILSQLARKLGFPLEYGGPDEIRGEIAALAPEILEIGITNGDRAPDVSEALSAYLEGGYLTGMADRYALPAALTAESEHPVHLYLGDSLYHNGRLSTHNWGLMRIDGVDHLLMNPREARKMKIRDGDRVRMASARGRAEVPVKLDVRVMPGSVFFPVHHAEPQVRDLVHPVTGEETEGHVLRFRHERVTLEKAPGPRPTP